MISITLVSIFKKNPPLDILEIVVYIVYFGTFVKFSYKKLLLLYLDLVENHML
jgi:hypothetical protein